MADQPARIPVLAPDVPAWLGEQGDRLIGLDLPSVDQTDDPSMQIHHRLEQANIIILENLDLRAVAPGIYELICLPSNSPAPKALPSAPSCARSRAVLRS